MKRVYLSGILCLLCIGCIQQSSQDLAPQLDEEVISESESEGTDMPTQKEGMEKEFSAGFDPLSKITDTSLLEDRIEISVPFTSQAPLGNWDPPFDEACEEASLLMVDAAYAGRFFTPEGAAEEIQEFANWVEERGYAIDTTAEEVARIAQSYLRRDSIVYTGEQVTAENIKLLLREGFPVIIPAAGRMLGNPYFSGDGPPYHMLVITGWEPASFLRGERFITNDPGTKRGEGYVYSVQVIMDAIHDWTGAKETIEQGQKAMVILAR